MMRKTGTLFVMSGKPMRAEPAEWLRRDWVYVRAAQQQDENFGCPPSHRDSILTFTAQVVALVSSLFSLPHAEYVLFIFLLSAGRQTFAAQ